jgi:hypothetical protein
MKLIDLQEAPNIIYSYNGVDVIDTKHATERFAERVKSLNLHDFFNRTIDKLLQLEQTMRNVPNELMVFSKSYNQGVIVGYDRMIDDTRQLYIITYLPPGERKFNKGTLPVLIEHEQMYMGHSKELQAYLSGIVHSRQVKLTEKTQEYGYFPVKLANNSKHKIILCNNKFYDVSIAVAEID